MDSTATARNTATRASDGKGPLQGLSTRAWGRMASRPVAVRIAMLILVLASIAAMSFAELGFWSIGIVDDKPVYLMLLLAPLVMGSLLFGPIMGGFLGLYSGAVVFAHATFLPLDYYEIYFMVPINTFGMLMLVGVLSGLLFDVALRNNPRGAVRVARMAAICALTSIAASMFVAIGTVVSYGGIENLERIREYLLGGPKGMATQMVLDILPMVALCCIADTAERSISTRTASRKLLGTFASWLALISSIVFMLAGSTIFSLTTIQEQEAANASMLSEVDYLAKQVELHDDPDPGILLEGYMESVDGVVVFLDESATITASDSDEYPIGQPFLDLVGVSQSGMTKDEFFAFAIDNNDTPRQTVIEEVDAEGASTMQFLFLAVDRCKTGYIAILLTPDQVFANRAYVMTSVALLALLLIAVTAIVAGILLRNFVIRRIDDANDSLKKITGGDLNERVVIQDSREFASLSAGINTTVSALKDSIAEAEQRNARELATAKAIQESALPREFPPFPDIDRFDVYASMKTAKEVGGDFYDFFLVEDHKLGFVIADVSGKGIPAALFMMTAKTQIRNYMEMGLNLSDAIAAANHQLCIGNDAGMFVTVLACLLDYETGELCYVNAGHNPPLVLHDGTWEWIRGATGLPLGLFDEMPYQSRCMQLETGDVLYLYTDGVTEAMDTDDTLFGEDRLEETLYEYASMNPRSIGVGVRRALTDFTLDAEQSDDITMLCLKYGVPPERRAIMILKAVDTQLIHVRNFIHEELHRRNAPKSAYNPLDIAAEELFVNVCRYAYPEATPEDPGEVRISFVYESNPPALTVEIADDGVPYNPLEKPDAVTPDDIAEVPIGGLGILMAKNSVDEMSYRRDAGSNVLTFKKGW